MNKDEAIKSINTEINQAINEVDPAEKKEVLEQVGEYVQTLLDKMPDEESTEAAAETTTDANAANHEGVEDGN